MGLKQELKHEIHNLLHDLDQHIRKTYTVKYEQHEIKLKNSLKISQLYIDDQLVDEKRYETILSHLTLFSNLKGSIVKANGKKVRVKARIGGLKKLSVVIRVGNRVLLRNKMSMDYLPWQGKTPIAAFIQKQIEEHGKLTDMRLPDQAYLYNLDEKQLPGYADYIGYEDSPLPLFEKNLIKHLKKLIDSPTDQRRRIIYEKVKDEYLVTYGHRFIEELSELGHLNIDRLEEEALWFLHHAAHREVLKFSLILLSLTNVERHKELLYQLALHEEFTPYALVGLSRLREDRHYYLWKLLDDLHGWGKVNLIPYIEAVTEEDKLSLLDQTFLEEEMEEAVALFIAENAELDTLFWQEDLSEELFIKGARIIYSLLKNGEIESYSRAEIALKRLEQLMTDSFSHIALPNLAKAIEEYKRDTEILD